MKLYVEVWLPRAEAGGIAIDPVAVGGRPLQTTLNDKKEAAVHERIMELVTVVHRRVFGSIAPTKIVELFKLGEGEPACMGIRLSEVVEGFYSFLGFTRLASENVVCKAVARGMREGIVGYYSGAPPELGNDGKFKVPPGQVRFRLDVPDDEIDLDSGFIMLPAAIPAPEAVVRPTPPGTGPTPSGGETITPGPIPPTPTPPPSRPEEVQRVVEISFSADRNALFTAWNAAANLADLAGKVNVTLRAESEAGFDKSKLQNGVIEPLREANLIGDS